MSTGAGVTDDVTVLVSAHTGIMIKIIEIAILIMRIILILPCFSKEYLYI